MTGSGNTEDFSESFSSIESISVISLISQTISKPDLDASTSVPLSLSQDILLLGETILKADPGEGML